MLYRKMIKNGFSAIVAAMIIFSFFVFVKKPAFAYVDYFFWQNRQNTNQGPLYTFQTYTATSSRYLSGVSLFKTSASDCTGSYLYFCKGDIASGDEWESRDCLNSEILAYQSVGDWPTDTYKDIIFNNNVYIINGQKYYISFNKGNGCILKAYSINIYAGGHYAWANSAVSEGNYSNGYDLTFKLFYSNAVPTGQASSSDQIYKPDPALSTKYPDFRTIDYQLCYIGSTCNLWFSYNDLSVGYPMYLFYYASTTRPTYEIASTTIANSFNFQNKILVPPLTISTSTMYNLLLDAGSYGWIVKTGITIRWIATSSEIFNYQGVCDTIATSTGSFLDDIRYSLECGFRRLTIWAFQPDPAAIEYFNKSNNQLKGSFPFNLVFSLTGQIQKTIAQNATSSNQTIGVPFVSATGTPIILPVLSSSSMANAIGSSNATLIRTTLNYLIWGSAAALIAGIIIFI